MIAVVDTNILLDVFLPNDKHLKSSESLLKRAYDSGALVINEIIYLELSPHLHQSITDIFKNEFDVSTQNDDFFLELLSFPMYSLISLK